MGGAAQEGGCRTGGFHSTWLRLNALCVPSKFADHSGQVQGTSGGLKKLVYDFA
jgi:hypothetical protein